MVGTPSFDRGLSESTDHKMRRDAALDLEHIGQAGSDFETITLDPVERVLHEYLQVHRIDGDIALDHVTLK
jgi:hypothetical protein